MKNFSSPMSQKTRAGRRAMVMKRVCDHSWFLSLGNFKSLSPTLPEAWEQGSQRRLSRSAPFVPVAATDGKDWGSKEGQSRRKSRMWRVEVGLEVA